MWTTSSTTEATNLIARQLHACRPIRIVATRCHGRGKIPGAHDQSIVVFREASTKSMQLVLNRLPTIGLGDC